MIPKTIHYCWFGGNTMPELAKKCIASWKKYCPDYEIIEWNETNYDVNKCVYMKEAYQAQKWGFVPDYARFDIIYHHGGIYLDTDVELLQSIDDFLKNAAFMGFEDEDHVNPGLIIGGEKGNKAFESIMYWYETNHFINESGEMNLTASPVIVSSILEKMGLCKEQSMQLLNGILTIYPKDYFCPMDYYTGDMKITQNTVSIHHYYASWLTPNQKRWIQLRRGLYKKLRPRVYQKIVKSHLFGIVGIFYTRGILKGILYYLKKGQSRK